MSRFEEVYAECAPYIQSMTSKRKGRIITSDISWEDWVQEGRVLLWKIFNKYSTKSNEEIRYIFITSFKRQIEHMCRNQREDVSIDEMLDVEYRTELSYLDDYTSIWVDFVLIQLKEILGDDETALLVLNNLLSPSSEVLAEIWEDEKRRLALKECGEKVNLVTNIKIKGVYLQKALKLTEKDLNIKLSIIRRALKKIYQEAS